MSRHLPRYPIYIVSKGRSLHPLTARLLQHDGVAFSIVVEPQEYDDYCRALSPTPVLVLPFSNLGLGSIPARNWIWSHAQASGQARHWILDDNIRCFFRRYKGKRIPCMANLAFTTLEDFVDRYENIALAGMNYTMFVLDTVKYPTFTTNVHVYSNLLIENRLSYRWRGRYNEDADLCLQVLSGGWCTLLVNAFLIEKKTTMTTKGGNTDSLYQGDGRLKMARSLERLWPGVVETKRRFQRPQHVIKHAWKHFDTPLKLKPGLILDNIEKKDYGLQLKQVRPMKSKTLQAFIGPRERKLRYHLISHISFQYNALREHPQHLWLPELCPTLASTGKIFRILRPEWHQYRSF